MRCMSCTQGKFFPAEWDDLEDVEHYMANQRGMLAGQNVALDDKTKKYISQQFPREKV